MKKIKREDEVKRDDAQNKETVQTQAGSKQENNLKRRSSFFQWLTGGQEDDKGPEEGTKKRSKDREIVFMTYIFVGLFTLLIGNFILFIAKDSRDVINNTYNKRQDLLAERIHRGEILGSKGEVLAHTIENGETSTRIYPYKNMFAHVVGRFSKGRTGIESSENFKLLTSNINPIKKVMNELSGDKNLGDNVITTLDVNVQKVAYDALGNRRGAVVVLEPDTGKILAMVSKPDYDPNKINDTWDTLVGKGKKEEADEDSALLNRATQGAYPPGSTFKILTALEYIRESKNYKDFEYVCKGHGVFFNVGIKCYNRRQHGDLNLISAFAKSCNVAFAEMGTKINRELFYRLCEDFLFNRDLPGNMPYKRSSFVLTADSDKSMTPQTVIGQGDTQISPYHNALIVAAIANGGTLMTPYAVDRIESADGTTIKKNLPVSYGQLLSASESKIMTDMMTEVIKSGTGTALNNSRYTAAGKTGSAEHAENKPAHAWFVGFAPAKKPKIAVSIIVEEVGTGSEYAVPIAKKIMDAYFR